MANQGKNKRRQLEVLDETHQVKLSVDSQEECDMVHWLDEAIQLSVINNYEYQPAPYILADSIRYVDVEGKQRTLYREHQYSPDFVVELNPNANIALSKEFKIRYDQLSSNACSVFIDTKGTFNRNARSFGTDRKWLWQKFKVYIYELVPQKFFKLFGVPEKCRLTAKTKKPRSAFLGFKSLLEVFSSSKR